jgi:hypothetical protein
VSGGVNQVDLVGLPGNSRVGHAHGRGLDCYAFLALQVHVVENLVLHVTLGNGARCLEEAIGQRRFAVIDMGDDAEVSNVVSIHDGKYSKAAPKA